MDEKFLCNDSIPILIDNYQKVSTTSSKKTIDFVVLFSRSNTKCKNYPGSYEKSNSNLEEYIQYQWEAEKYWSLRNRDKNEKFLGNS